MQNITTVINQRSSGMHLCTAWIIGSLRLHISSAEWLETLLYNHWVLDIGVSNFGQSRILIYDQWFEGSDENLPFIIISYTLVSPLVIKSRSINDKKTLHTFLKWLMKKSTFRSTAVHRCVSHNWKEIVQCTGLILQLYHSVLVCNKTFLTQLRKSDPRTLSLPFKRWPHTISKTDKKELISATELQKSAPSIKFLFVC